MKRNYELRDEDDEAGCGARASSGNTGRRDRTFRFCCSLACPALDCQIAAVSGGHRL
jgi:hypothetical protein